MPPMSPNFHGLTEEGLAILSMSTCILHQKCRVEGEDSESRRIHRLLICSLRLQLLIWEVVYLGSSHLVSLCCQKY